MARSSFYSGARGGALNRESVDRLEGRLQTSLNRLDTGSLRTLQRRSRTYRDGNFGMASGELYVVNCGPAESKITAFLPETGEEGQEVGVVFETGQGVCLIRDPAGVNVGAVHDARQMSIFRRVGGAWYPLTGD